MNGDTPIAGLRAARQETLEGFSRLDPARLREKRTWRGAESSLYFRLSWLAEGDDMRRVRVIETLRGLGHPLSVAQVALAGLGETRGRLLGALVGLPEDRYDQPPAEGEWSVRQVLGHVIAIDRRYAIAVQYALGRARSGGTGPLRPPASALPPQSGGEESTGAAAELLARLVHVRDAVNAEIAAVPDDLLGAPTNWVSWDLDVRFRIHRFAAHDREHTIQIRKVFDATGFRQSEPQMLLADAMAVRGALEAAVLGVPAALLAQEPPGGGPSIADILDEALADERDLRWNAG